jgi:hypothetical protein
MGTPLNFRHGALLDRLTHHVHNLTMNRDSYRLKQSAGRRRATTSHDGAEQNQASPKTNDQVDASAVNLAIVEPQAPYVLDPQRRFISTQCFSHHSPTMKNFVRAFGP